MISKHRIYSLFCGRTIEDTHFFRLVLTEWLRLYEIFIYSHLRNFMKNRNVVLFLATKALLLVIVVVVTVFQCIGMLFTVFH